MYDWNTIVKRIIKSELVKRGLSTEGLVRLLNDNGYKETKSSVDSKISRGTFSAAFFMQCLYVIGCSKIEMYGIIINISEEINKTVAPNVKYKTSKNDK